MSSPLSVVVPTRDRAEQLRRCVASIRASLRVDDQLVIVDSASLDARAVEAIASEAGAQYVRVDRPGVNRARNAGWRVCTNALIAFVDDDVVVDTGWADAFTASAELHANAAFLTGRLSPLNEAAHGNVAVKDDLDAAMLSRASRGDIGHGANLLVRTDALAAIGGWDDALGNGGRFKSAPEADLYDRLFAAGFLGRYEPSARAWHDQWRTSTQLVKLDWRYGFGNGARISKLVRADRPRARLVAGEAAWGWGLQRLGAPLRDRNKTEVARVLARLAGTVAGAAAGFATRVENGHFVERASNSS